MAGPACGPSQPSLESTLNQRFAEDSMNGATQQQMPEITATELKQRIDNGEDIQIIDVREDHEVAIAKIPNTIHIPLGQVLNRMSEIDPNKETVSIARWAAAARMRF